MSPLPEGVARLVDGVNYAHVATVLPSGAPHSVPVWIDREGDRLAVLTSLGSRKARNLTRDPRVAISIIDHDRPQATALIRGRLTTVLDGDEGWKVIDRIAAKYTGDPYPLRTDRVVLLFEADRADAYDFG
ncbi:TIGR03618 family F420-dependent PPOX class oxidoreductase [Dactylosporangium sp. AC04546]|uniref:pyridoxamine 5'-phosphate oxidase family protein n=1 Tax=Dactylosporangium sp. AC04546 TaxID=2862460 RepID=UPI001EDEE161|nr:TIGR03618 family F420-dependent PPOX class oxidoreductase [Dactylosporangium sp. AC04546]WVK82462.1 TIGR03618 family F420-dependent PPOX class oxidoreductase [Dactylosporangium sp. AC04546]